MKKICNAEMGKKALLTLSFLALAMNLIAALPPAHAQPANLMLMPPTNTYEPGTSFVITVYITDVYYLDGYDITIKFAPTVLSSSTGEEWITDGGFLSSGGASTAGIQPYYESGSIRVTDSIISPSGAYVSGSGILFQVQFHVEDSGRTTLHIDDTTILWDYSIPPNYIDYTPKDSLFYTDMPKAHFRYNYTDMQLRNPVIDETITFNATYDPPGRGSYDPDNPAEPLSNYHWDFGDGTIVDPWTDPVITHNYTATGQHTVTLTVTDNEGETDTYSTPPLTLSYYDLEIDPEIKVYPTVAHPGSTVTINVTATNYGTENIYFNLTLHYDSTLIWYNKTEDKNDFCLYLDPPATGALLSGSSLTVTYQWNTTGIPEATYTIKANATITKDARTSLQNVEDETNNQAQTSIIITSAPINIAVKSISVEKTAIPLGEGPITITVVVENQGNIREETVSLALYYNSTLIENRTGVTIPQETSIPVSFSWDTTTLDAGVYILTANASEVLNEMVLEDNSLTYEGSVIISYPPTANFTHSPTEPKVNDLVTFDASTSEDPDGLITQYSWDFGDESPKHVTEDETVVHRYTSVGTYTVTLNVTDNATLTDTFTLQITIAKATSTISISLSQTTITFNNNVVISGAITPTRNQANVTLQYRIQGETTWKNITTTKTNATSQYSHTWTPPTAGIYEIQAIWLGDANTAEAQSQTTTLTINKATSTISITLSREKATVGTDITISGAISPLREDVAVTVHYRVADGTWNTLGTATTNSSGQFSYIWTPSEEGTYEIKTSWDGDTNTEADESDVKTVTVEAAAPFIDLFYVGAGIAIIAIVSIIALYFLKLKKP